MDDSPLDYVVLGALDAAGGCFRVLLGVALALLIVNLLSSPVGWAVLVLGLLLWLGVHCLSRGEHEP
jgi:hypothetical protein